MNAGAHLDWKWTVRYGLFVLCLLPLATPAPAQTWSNGYTGRRVITIDHTKVPNTDQSNFPLLVSGTYSDLATTSNGGNVTSATGYDIIFTSDAAGSTLLAFEREGYSSTTGSVNFWVKVPLLSHTTDTAIYMFYGNSAVTTDQSNAVAVWDSNYKGVWHLDQTPNGSGSILDSTSNGYNGTPASSGIAFSSAGIAGGSLNFDGVSNGNDVTFSSSAPGGPPITASIWIETKGLNSNAQSQILAKFQWSSSGWGIYDDGQYDANVFLRPYPNYNNIVDIPRSTINNGVWHYLTATIDVSNTLRFYLDGSQYGTTTTSSITADTTDPLVIGGFGGNAGGGLLTEARVSNTVRSADWIATEYNNQSSPASFYRMGGPSGPQENWSNGYGYRRVIVIDHTKVSNSDQTNFPVLIAGTFPDMATASNGGNVTNSNGYDILVTSDASGTTPLAYDRDTYNPATGAFDFWVKVPTLSHTTDTVVYVFYGNSAVTTDQSNKTAVWDSNYLAVWHLGEASGQQNDSTSNGNNSTAVSVTAEGTATGQIGGADQFNANHPDHVDLPNMQLASAFTLELWMNPTSVVDYERIFAKAYSSNTAPWDDYWINFNTAASGTIGIGFDSAGTAVGVGSNSAIPLGQWTHVVGTYDGSTMRIYLNGVQDNSGAITGTVATISEPTEIGYNSQYGPQSFTGSLDEIRMSSSARSADWIATEYNNQSSPWSFSHVGMANGPMISSVSPTSGTVGTTVTVSGSNFGTVQGNSSVTFNGTPAAVSSWSDTQVVASVPSGAMPGDIVVTSMGVQSNGVFFMVPTSWSNGYSYRRAITIDHTRVPNTDQKNFPFLISGTFPYLAASASGGDILNASGYDIIFTSDAAGTHPLPYERETYTPTTGAMQAWVQLPTVSHTSDTIAYMFYGNSGITTDQSNRTAVWDSNYKGVWHLANGTTLSATDSTSNGNNGTLVNAPTAVAGQIDGAANFNASNSQYISVPDSSGLKPTSLTFSFWMKESGNQQQWAHTLLKGAGSSTPYGAYFFQLNESNSDSSEGSLYVGTTDGVPNPITYPSGSFANNGWYYIVGTFDSSTDLLTGYKNGQTIGKTKTSIGTLSYDTTGLSFGREVTYGQYFNGALDEVRVSSIPRSADWVTAEYNNQSSPSTFYNIGSAYTSSSVVTPTVLALSPASGIVGTSVTITGSDLGATQGSSIVTFNGATTTPTSWSSTIILAPVPTGASTGPVEVNVSGVSSDGAAFTVVPVISSTSGTTCAIGAQLGIFGTGFGPTQGSSQVTLNGSAVTVTFWSATSISITIPTGATSGSLLVSTGAGNNSNSVYVTITPYPLPTDWLDQDVGNVGSTGSGTYSGGQFTVSGGGGFGSNGDAFHFVYQNLSGDGSIVARLLSAQGGQFPMVGLMIRETMSPTSTDAMINFIPNQFYFSYRTTTGGGGSQQTLFATPAVPYWMKLVRTGNTFSAYWSQNAVDWTQVGSSVTINMASNVYVGLFAAGSTGVFDSISLSSTAIAAPVISGLSNTTGAVGSQIVISGANFGTSQGDGEVILNDVSIPVNSWSASSITVTIPAGAASGLMEVLAPPSLNASNPVEFGVTSHPLPTGWFDQDVGAVVTAGTATYSNGLFTVQGAGQEIGGSADAFHFVYQPLSGDGSIVARLVSLQNAGTSYTAGVMIRETMLSGSTYADVNYTNNGGNVYYFPFAYRTTTGGSSGIQGGQYQTLPAWIKLTRSGNTFTGYSSPDGVTWVQLGSQSITMATNVNIGLDVSSGGTSYLVTATFDNVSVSSSANPAPTITSVSATTGSVGSQITITGTNLGSSQGGSAVLLNDLPMTVNSWSNTSITVTIASGAVTGYLGVAVAPNMNSSNAVLFTITTNPLPSGWLDQDVGTVGIAGSATYSNGTFTVNGAGSGIGQSADAFHFAYQTLSGDGSIVARIVNTGAVSSIGVMVRSDLTAGAVNAAEVDSNNYYYWNFNTTDRPTAGGSTTIQNGSGASLPYWVMLTRSGSTFTGYMSPDGVYWTQVGNSVSISMSTAYVGFAVTSGTTSQLGTGSFDNVSVTQQTPYLIPNISGVSPDSGGIGNSVTITGTNFGSVQGSSSVFFNGSTATSITSWSTTQIMAAVPSSASTGPVTVVVNGLGSNKNNVYTLYNPVISSVTPPAAPVGGSVVITGTGFGTLLGNTGVSFNGSTASIRYWSETSITAAVPNNAISGPVTVIEGGVASAGVQFTVLEPTTISGISPSFGPIGSSVVVTGTGFGPTQSSSLVHFFGETAITITNWSDTSITAVVPAGMTSGPVWVSVAGSTIEGPVFTLTARTHTTDSLGNTSYYDSVIAGASWASLDSQGSGCSTCSIRGNTQSTYDANGNVLTATDPAGHTTTYTYDSSNNMLSQSAQLDSTHTATNSYTYNALSEVLTATDPLGNVTTNTYDNNGNLISVTSPAPNSSTTASVTQFAYNSLGELTTITDPLSHVTTMTYTAAGLVATITDAQNNVTTYGYDARGNRTSVTDALNHATSFTYDAMSRLTRITYPDTTTTQFAYDSRGRRTSVTDQNNKTTSYAYDDADRLTSVTDAASHVTYYAYDTEDNLTSITDANSNQTAFTYDAFGRVTKTNFPSSLNETYQYDAENNLTQKTDRKNQTIQYLYDALNRLTQKTYPDTTTVDYTYDLVGKIQQVNDPTGTYAFAYDNMGRLIGTTTSYSFLTSRNFTNAYTYDAASNRTGFTDPENGSTAYTYDTLNRLTSLAPPSAFGSGSFGFSYDALSRRTQMTRPNSVTTNYAYDNLSRLTSILHQLSGSTIDGAAYTLDNAGNRTAKTDQLAGVTSNYTYDAIYQLTQVTQANNTTESYSYDAVGNRTASLGVSSYTANASNELTATSNASYTYDSNGNTLTKTAGSNTTSYTWNFENQMSSVTLPGSSGTVTFKYDPFGRRIYKSSSSATSIFVYDEDTLVETVNSSGVAVSRYMSSNEVDEPLAESASGATSFFEEDGLGSVSSLTNSSASVLNSYTYDSFGNLVHSSGSASNPLGYTGRELDSETGLYYYRARYYDPTSGRFTGEDPLLFGGGGSNFYSYVENQAVDETDPFGMSRHCKYGNCKRWRTFDHPTNSVVYTPPAGSQIWVSSSVDWCKEFAAAQAHPFSLSHPIDSKNFIAGNIGTSGTYDYQRDPSNRIFYSDLENTSNFSVGVFWRGVGLPRGLVYPAGLGYAVWTHSSNLFKKGQIGTWSYWWGAGWDSANSGAYAKANCGCSAPQSKQ
jgi:RHS repeat-associated protein